MKDFRRVICVLMCLAISFGSAGCSDISDMVDVGKDNETNIQHRDEYVSDEKDKTPVEDTTGSFEYEQIEWQGPEGYVIVVPAKDTAAKEAAEHLQNYYGTKHNISLSVVTDNTKEAAKEILIGKTSRKESANELKASQLSVQVVGEKLVFGGGHYVTVETAVNRFIRLEPEKNKAFVFESDTDFSVTPGHDSLPDGYKYVWGDEFEGNDIDLTKWDFAKGMADTTKMEMSCDRDVIDVADGRLKLKAIHYYNPRREGTCFKVPLSTVTEYKMNYLYGYVEIRASIPFGTGLFPSFWTRSTDILKGSRSKSFMAEIDFFESFGSVDTIHPHLHKWWANEEKYVELGGKEPRTVSTTEEDYYWNWSEKGIAAKDLNNQYHLYGCEWTSKEISMYVDGEKYCTYDITKSYDETDDMSGFHDPIYILFNFHLYTEDFQSDKAPIEHNLDNLPADFDIDWIRLYQKEGVGALYIDKTPKVYTDRDMK